MRLLRTIRARRLKPLIADQEEFYSRHWTPAEIRAWQLERFNEQWERIRQNVPYFSDLARAQQLPEEFSSWQQFSELLPVMDRKLIQNHREDLRDHTQAPDFVRTTGGSTGEPVQLPGWNSEREYSNKDIWYARSWFGISPADKLLLIWGHSHQLGAGVKGRLNAIRRQTKDALLGYRRCSAYDLGTAALRRAADTLIAFKPAYVIAYSVALDRFARVNADRSEQFRQLRLKAAIATAEAFPRSDSADQIAAILGCPVVMEYGAVESGAVAHQRPDGRFVFFWRHWFVEGVAASEVPGAFEIYLTSLNPRCFPLVRYRIGDLLSQNPNDPDFDQTFERVIGRCNDCIELGDGTIVHSEAFAHAVKECASVLSFQVVQGRNGNVHFNYVSAPQCATEEVEIRRRLAAINPALQHVSLNQVKGIPQTIAGKTRTIVREEVHVG